jgi:hypothetical protein
MCIEDAFSLNNRSVVLTPRQIQLRCLKSCTSNGPFYFRGWEHRAAWAMCSVNHEWCVPAAESLYVMLGGGSLTGRSLVGAAANYSKVLRNAGDYSSATGGGDMWHAHQYCFFVTLAQGLPWFFVVFLGLVVLLGLLKLPFVIVSAWISLFAQIVAFTHAGNN